MHHITADAGEGQNESGGRSHAYGGLQLIRDTHERAQAQKLDQHKIVHQYGAEQNNEEFHRPLHRWCACKRAQLTAFEGKIKAVFMNKAYRFCR